METYFATPQRSDNSELLRQLKQATNNPIIDGVMRMAGGLIAVLNQNRQILSVNHKLLGALGVEDPNEILGLRPGEALGCVYSDETAAGCGTSVHCVTCGAAIAIVATLGTHGPVDKTCSITLEKQGKQVDMFFNVHASTIKIKRERYVLIFLNDMTRQQQRAALERVFFHDIKNTIMALLNASEMLALTPSQYDREIVKHIITLSKRISKEVALQQHLSENGGVDIGICHESLRVDAILEEMEKAASQHPSKKAHRLKITNYTPGMVIYTDLSLLMRVLANMLINAFEADDSDEEVRLDVESQGNEIIFSVWNRDHISTSVKRRIFQRNFSTKNELGRGLGTYSMKLIGEQLLAGRVYFESTPKQGTRFFMALPINVRQ